MMLVSRYRPTNLQHDGKEVRVAKVKIEEIVDHLSYEMRNALAEAVLEHLPNVTLDEDALFRTFKSAVYRKCSTWENVPDRYVEKG